MSKAVLLLADNDPKFLATYKELLEREDYEVVTASTPIEIRRCLKRDDLDLAILDIRMENDDKESDRSGLMVAKESAPSVPIIFLTGFPTFELATTALRQSLEGIRVAVDFVSKHQDWPTLCEAIETALIKRDVFIVHGHDPEALVTVEDLIRSLKLKPVILNDLPGGGNTIIEMIEKYGDVAYVAVLMTPDDFGGSHAQRHVVRDRARQNVILELGFFMGKLGRSRVITLVKGDIEIPSDYLGVRYITMDPGDGWRLHLANELNRAGFFVDFNVFKNP